MGTEVLRPHDCLARAKRPRPLRPAAGRRTAAARQGQGQGQGQCQGRGARGDWWRSPSAAATVPRQVVRTKVAAADAYAGTAFGAMSPSPRALPLPRFSTSRTVADATVPGVDDAATREIRRLLGLQ